jgi:serine/threonine protein phosphatase PrpC
MALFLRYAAKSDVGMVRSANEDSGFAGRALLAVADGMGGHAAGELASSTAIATLAELDSEELEFGDLLTALDDAVVTSAARIGQFIEADPSRTGMGTTLTALLWQDGRLAVIHVGDSRAYLLRDGELSQITHDHTYVQSLIDAGRITSEEARRHPKRNLLLRAIDGTQVPEGESSVREAQAGDRYLLCSDGLSGVVDDDGIARVLREVPDPTAAVTALVDLALEAGAPDNVTAVVADVVEAGDEEAAQETALITPVVVGAAGEPRNRAALPGLEFPADVSPDAPESSTARAVGGATVGGTVESGPAGTGPGTGSAEPDDRPGFVRRHAGALAVTAIVVAGLAIGVAGFLWWLGSQWFVGSHVGYVTVYRGIPQAIAGVPLNRVVTQTALEVSSLPYYDQQQVERTIDAMTQADAERIVADLASKAAACQADPAPLGCPPPPSPQPSASPSATASPGPSPTAGVTR